VTLFDYFAGCNFCFILTYFFLGPASASDMDLDLMRIQRNLLQEKTVEDIPKVGNYGFFAQFPSMAL
jgi:phage gp45-like